MLHFCTYFDHAYLSRALALHASLQRHCSSFTLWALCLSDESYEAIRKLAHPEIEAIQLVEFEAVDPEFFACKTTRSKFEYFMTSTPCFPRYLLRVHPEIDTIHYVDADLYFFSDPRQIVDELGICSVAITPHRFPTNMQHEAEQVGTYNVGWLSFKNDDIGRKCLDWWRARCIEWCHYRVEPNRFADQKYLDEFQERFGSVKVIQNRGANLAPWNLENHHIVRERSAITVDNNPLVFFHFSGIRHVAGRWYQCARYHATTKFITDVRYHIYRPYLLQIKKLDEQILSLDLNLPSLHLIRKSAGLNSHFNSAADWLSLLRGCLRGNILWLR